MIYMLALFATVVFFIAIPTFLWKEKEPTLPVVKTEADPEVVNGILTVAGIIFGFQFAFFKAPTASKLRAIWVFALVYQVFAIAWVAFNYVNDTMEHGFLTTDTLKTAYFVFATIVLATVLNSMVDWLLTPERSQ